MMGAVARITIDLSGTGGEDSIQDAWGMLYTLQQKYMVELKDKQVVKLLLTNLLPKSTRKVIEALQHAGSQRQQNSIKHLGDFHWFVLDIARTNKRAFAYGLIEAARTTACYCRMQTYLCEDRHP